jgi:CRISPR-associated endonuclease Csn1
MASELVFGFDIGTTSIGSAVVKMDSSLETGRILHLGVRIFPEARDPEGIPLNQERRKRRMMRRQLRRRRIRRRELNRLLCILGLLPEFSKSEASAWADVMGLDPWQLRTRALSERLTPAELGRAIYHIAQRRHFRGRDLEIADAQSAEKHDATTAEEEKAASQREKDRSALRESGLTLGAFIASIPERSERRRGYHFARDDVAAEFRAIVAAQAPHHEQFRDPELVAAIEQTIFEQKPVFWRKATLGSCRFNPGAELAGSASWIAQEKRMLEKLNNLRIEEGNGRPLDDQERSAILKLLRKQDSVSWAGIHRHLKLYWRKHGLPEKPTFNLQRGGEKGLIGNRLENRLSTIMGDRWDAEPDLRQRMRREIHARLYAADYSQIGGRIVIRREAERRQARVSARESLKADFALTEQQAHDLAKISFAPGWEPFSSVALWEMLPRLQHGVALGTLLAGPEEEVWRASTFPHRFMPTGSWVDRLPTPGNSREESDRQKAVRNPTVLRVQNELRKVVNNLISVYGRPDRIRVEVARDVGKSAHDRADDLKRNRDREKERKRAFEELQKSGIAQPSRQDVEKWMLWEECNRQCPYTGRMIDFAALFHHGEFQVEHIWPRWRSMDDSFANKTLCHRDFNLKKSNRTPFEAFEHDAEGWEVALKRVRDFAGPPGRVAVKAKRFAATEMPSDFAARQLTDTGYAARQAVGFLKMLFPDLGQSSEVRVATLSGRVTSRLRHNWGLNQILHDSGEKTRADHRHHALDALVVAIAHPGYTQRLSMWFKARDAATPMPEPLLGPPFGDVREQLERRISDIIVSHRVRRKVSGPLHKDTIYGDAGPAEGSGGIAYRWFVTTKKIEDLSARILANDDAWPDAHVRDRIRDWVEKNGGSPKKALLNGYPTVSEGGAPIRKVRIREKQQAKLMAQLKSGFADLGNNHHALVYLTPNGKSEFRIVSLFEAATRLRRGLPPVDSSDLTDLKFKMSLAAGDTIKLGGERAGLWIVRKMSANGQITLWPINDADAEKHKTIFEPTIGGMVSRGLEKIAVDPIGRIRPARD